MANKPIFFDASGRRATRVSVIGWVVAVVSTLLFAVFVGTLFAAPQMAHLRLPGQLTPITFAKLEPTAKDPALLRSAARLAAKARTREALARRWRQRDAAAGIYARPKGRPLSIAFYGNWGDTSENFADLKQALPKLDWVIPTWLNLAQSSDALKTSLDPNL